MRSPPKWYRSLFKPLNYLKKLCTAENLSMPVLDRRAPKKDTMLRAWGLDRMDPHGPLNSEVSKLVVPSPK